MNAYAFSKYVAILIVTTFLLCSCDGNSRHNDLKTFINNLKNTDIKNNASESTSTLREPRPVGVTYNSASNRSPFEILEITSIKKNDTSNPLQVYPLNLLRFVGTVTQNGNNIAFIMAPDNRLYQIRVGDMIGDHDSEVVAIESNRISLIEKYVENGNTAMKRVVTLQLKDANQ